jgi:hypothetical protein
MEGPTPQARTFDVYPYSLDTLLQLISGLSPLNSKEAIAAKAHSVYLDGYLREIRANTIVVEKEYIDKDYLEDFAAYYVKCFRDYPKTCSRLHFFEVEFNVDDFESLLAGSTARLKAQQLQQSYCGFVVIKPLPQTIIGRTCLRTYSSSSSRSYPVARKFRSHLFGIHLTIDETLPFQEQDNVVAACATSALWSVFQATALEFQHALMTPVEITRAATDHFPAETRMIPNRSGLSTAMMAHAIRSVDLEPVLLSLRADEDATLRANVYAYLSGRIPLLMGVRLYDLSMPKGQEFLGHHAVAIVGYNLNANAVGSQAAPDFQLKAGRIDKLYAHDDQIGPFARMAFDGLTVQLENPDGSIATSQSLSTSWPASDGSTTKVRAVPTMLLVPLYHKIRIRYEDAFESVCDFDGFLATIRHVVGETVVPRLEWDIRITDVNGLKQDIAIGGTITQAARLRWLTSSMPRFMWRATAATGQARVFDLLFDATDIHTSDGVHAMLCYDPTVEALLRTIATNPVLSGITDLPNGARKVLGWLGANPSAAA